MMNEDTGYIGRTNTTQDTKRARDRITKVLSKILTGTNLWFGFRIGEKVFTTYKPFDGRKWNKTADRSIQHEACGSGLMVWLFSKEDPSYRVLVQVWVRPYGNKMLGVYPRLNLPVDRRSVRSGLAWAKGIDLYFLTILLDRDKDATPRQYWMDMYGNIPAKDWYCDARYRGGRKDRLLLKNAEVWHKKYHLVGVDGSKKDKYRARLGRIRGLLDYQHGKRGG